MMEAQETHKEDKAKARYVTPYGYGVLDNFGAQLIGRLLTFELMNNKMVTGKLKGYGQFDIMVTDLRTGQDYNNHEARYCIGSGRFFNQVKLNN